MILGNQDSRFDLMYAKSESIIPFLQSAKISIKEYNDTLLQLTIYTMDVSHLTIILVTAVILDPGIGIGIIGIRDLLCRFQEINKCSRNIRHSTYRASWPHKLRYGPAEISKQMFLDIALNDVHLWFQLRGQRNLRPTRLCKLH